MTLEPSNVLSAATKAAVTRLRRYRSDGGDGWDLQLVDAPTPEEEEIRDDDINTRHTPPPPLKVIPYDEGALLKLLMSSIAQRAGVLAQPGLHTWRVTIVNKAIAYKKPIAESNKLSAPPGTIYSFLVAGSPATTHDELLAELHRIQIPIVQKVNGKVFPLSQFLILTKRED